MTRPPADSPELTRYGARSLRLELSGHRGVPLGFVQEGDAIYLIAKERTALWPVEILRSGVAVLDLENARLTGAVGLVTDKEERARVLGVFLTKYGTERFHSWYEHPYRVLKVETRPAGPAVLSTEGQPGRYYTWLTDEFNNVAWEYDKHILGNPINRLLRDRSLVCLRRSFAHRKHILEIGCGSGTETLVLLKEGHEVTAVDISPTMLEVIRGKARAEGVSERLRTVHLPAREVGELLAELGEGAFDGGYSTYGALNSEPGIREVPRSLHRLLKPSSVFIAGVYNRWCLFEMVGYLLRGKWGRAWARMRADIPVGGSRFCIDVYSYSAMEMSRIFRPYFRTLGVEGVTVVLPPSDLVRYLDAWAPEPERMYRLDARVGRIWPLCNLGDHYLLSLQRSDAGDPP